MDHPQQLVQCPYCVNQVKANRLSLHITKAHRTIVGKQQCILHTDHKVDNLHEHLNEECGAMAELRKNAYDSGGISTVPPPVPCKIDYGIQENWDDSNHPGYQPLESTQNKDIIRGYYASGLKPAEKKRVVAEERARRAELCEKENADRLNRINYSRSNNLNNIPKSRPIVGRPTNGNVRQTNSNNCRATDSDSNITSVSAQPLRIDPTTDSDGFVSVNYNRRNNSTVSRGRGRGRSNQNQK